MDATMLMALNWALMAWFYFRARRENNQLRKEKSELLHQKIDLMDEVHHLKVKYGELPVLNFVMGTEDDTHEEEHS